MTSNTNSVNNHRLSFNLLLIQLSAELSGLTSKTMAAVVTAKNLLLLVFFSVCFSTFRVGLAQSASWSLSFDQRREFLRHYAPLLFKRAVESSSKRGFDWVTNFDFDTDQVFSNNKDNWEDLDNFVDESAHTDWNIRPTMYTAMLEYMSPDGLRKDATLLYHVYHAKQTYKIHDWERVEVRLTGITGDPGSGEEVSYVVVTEHHKHNVRLKGHGDLNFMTTENGKHPMIWQAQQDVSIRDAVIDFLPLGSEQFFGGELHFVEDPFEKILDLVRSDDKAEVDVNGGDEKNFHYIFVPQDDREAVSFWSALTLAQSNAFDLSHGSGYSGIPVSEVKRIRYELQDLADIVPTHWAGGFYERHWTTAKTSRILLEAPLDGGLDGGPSVPAGMQTFYARSKDDEDKKEDRNGYPVKSWFWGAYEIGDESISSEARADPERGVANGDPTSVEEEYYHQHDFYVHDGPKGVTRWLPKGWHNSSNGGFDGRWVQLF